MSTILNSCHFVQLHAMHTPASNSNNLELLLLLFWAFQYTIYVAEKLTIYNEKYTYVQRLAIHIGTTQCIKKKRYVHTRSNINAALIKSHGSELQGYNKS